MPSLLRSRKVLLSVLALVQTVINHYVGVPIEVWGAIDLIAGWLIAWIAVEDAAVKASGRNPESA